MTCLSSGASVWQRRTSTQYEGQQSQSGRWIIDEVILLFSSQEVTENTSTKIDSRCCFVPHSVISQNISSVVNMTINSTIMRANMQQLRPDRPISFIAHKATISGWSPEEQRMYGDYIVMSASLEMWLFNAAGHEWGNQWSSGQNRLV